MQGCVTIPAVSNGVLNPVGVDPIVEGAMLTIACGVGYAPVGETTSTCTSGILTPDISGTTCGE